LNNFVRAFAYGDNARFIEHDAFTPDANEGVAGTQIDAKIDAEQAENVVEESQALMVPDRAASCPALLQATIDQVAPGRRVAP
jgi:hypothetical protein